MIKKNLWHHRLLTTTAIGISLVATYSVINPNAGNHSVATFAFPEQIPLPFWEYRGNQAINVSKLNSEKSQDVIQSANRYQYQENDTRLDIEVYYLTDTRGNVESLLVEQTKITPESLKTQEIEQQDNGYYSIFSDRDRTYLSSCLNPTGNSTVTQKQFSQNLDRRQLNLKLLGNWLLGKDSIRDRRCLWVTISIPNDNSSFLQPRGILEQVWQNWYEWWQPRFPSL
ncbi:conserved hypothetical protein [Hyella patelloides LEGE 07179]|uniref:Cyanoexosortase A system-associated protein n=1 Tax=Hyella patelloides LEGE 07179 TaxID=945734 RepID=A0A563VLB5_9CYAN|nr:cyanoexosortase A system-associated protein [Hyella patelloides]VEP12229.1 conserved hypothetical protein [Hyella patelloides LEGE 07179]